MDKSGFLVEWNKPSDTMVVHTSGSTGVPKEITVSKLKMLASARTTCDFLGLKKGDRALLCMSLDYIAGKMMVVRSIERALNLVCLTPSNHPFATLSDDEPNFDLVAMVPSQVFCTLSVPREARMLKACRHLIIGGGAVSAELSQMLESFPNHVWSSYGMTETLSHIALRPLNGEGRTEWYEAFEGVELSLDKEGCLVINAPYVCDERLKTNDFAILAEDGRHFKILGRRDNVICSGGIKLQMEKIEEQLSRRLKTDFCITKRADSKFGEAAVLLVASGAVADLSEIESALEDLDPYSRPKDIIFVNSIPLTGTGKIDRASAMIMANGYDKH